MKDYNDFMGGVDHHDQLRATYGMDRRSKKWWHRLFWGMLEMVFVNSYVIYQDLNGNIPLLEYRRLLVQGLQAKKELPTPTRGLFLKKTVKKPVNKKRRGKYWSVSSETRFGNRGIHWPKFSTERGRCEVCSMEKIQSRPHSKCSHCGNFLCCNEKKNCFFKFHCVP